MKLKKGYAITEGVDTIYEYFINENKNLRIILCAIIKSYNNKIYINDEAIKYITDDMKISKYYDIANSRTVYEVVT